MQEVDGNIRSARIRWTFTFIVVFLAPWVLLIGSANLFEWAIPGQIKTDYWRNLSSLGFFAGGAVGAMMLWQMNRHLIVRIFAILLLLVWSGWFAFMVQLRSNCGDETEYIGERKSIENCG